MLMPGAGKPFRGQQKIDLSQHRMPIFRTGAGKILGALNVQNINVRPRQRTPTHPRRNEDGLLRGDNETLKPEDPIPMVTISVACLDFQRPSV